MSGWASGVRDEGYVTPTVDDTHPAFTSSRTLSYGNYGVFLLMGHAGSGFLLLDHQPYVAPPGEGWLYLKKLPTMSRAPNCGTGEGHLH